jgi:hypothetical protein
MPLYRRDTRAGKSDALDHHDKAQRDGSDIHVMLA